MVRCGAVALSGWPVVIINNKDLAPPDRGDIPRASPLLFSVSKERHAAKIPCDVLSAEQQQNSVSQSLLSPQTRAVCTGERQNMFHLKTNTSTKCAPKVSVNNRSECYRQSWTQKLM